MQAELPGWTEREVDLGTEWQAVALTRTALVREPWAIHVEAEDWHTRQTGSPERRLSLLTINGWCVAWLRADRCTDADVAGLADRLERLKGVDWPSLTFDDCRNPSLRRRVRGVVKRWKAALAGAKP